MVICNRPLSAESTRRMARYAESGGALLEQAITPISDVRSSADYRLQVAKNMLHRWVASLVD